MAEDNLTSSDFYDHLLAELRTVVAQMLPGKTAEEQEDIVQEVAIDVWNILDKEIKAPQELTWTYLRRVVFSVFVDSARRSGRAPNEVPLDLQDGLEAARRGQEFEAALGRLDRSQRRAMVLHYLGHSVREISMILDCDYEKAASLVHRGLAQLRQNLSPISPADDPAHGRPDELFFDSSAPDLPPEPLVQSVQAISAEVIKYLAKHPEEIYEIKPRQFEELVAEILASYGWQVQLTPTTRDGGYDLFAISKDQAGVESSWIIECKKHREDRKVGIDVVRTLYGIRNVAMPAGMLMLATTSYFSKEVHAFKESRYDLALRDYEGILEWLNEYRPNPNGRLYIKDNQLVVPGEKQ